MAREVRAGPEVQEALAAPEDQGVQEGQGDREGQEAQE